MNRLNALLRGIFSIALAALLGHTAAQAQKAVIWNRPATEAGTDYGDGYFNMALDVDKVELLKDETRVHLTIRQRSDFPERYRFSFSSRAFLSAGGRNYALRSVEGLEPDKPTLTGRDGTLRAVFHFEPLPADTRRFQFTGGDNGSHRIEGICPVEERWKQLFPSYWRDDATGHWTLALLDEGAVYRCRFWRYKERNVDAATGRARLVMQSGDEELTVEVGRNKKGRRTIRTGRNKATLSMITDRFVPDYPRKDTCTAFVDNGFRTDTITIAGWIKDMPEVYRKQRTFRLSHKDFLTDELVEVHADMDGEGHFEARIPVTGGTEFFCDWGRCFIRTVLEPGRTYFLFYDFKEGRRFFMGDDSRLQNELFKYPFDWESCERDRCTDPVRYTASVDSMLKVRYACIDSLCAAHPTLSARFARCRKENSLWMQAFEYGQARFRMPGYRFTPEARRYACDTFWKQLKDPLGLHRDISSFLHDFLDDMTRDQQISLNVNDYLPQMAGNEAEKDAVRRYLAANNALEKAAGNAAEAEKQRIVAEWNKKNADLVKQISDLIKKESHARMLEDRLFILTLQQHRRILDSLGAPASVTDIHLTRLAYNHIENRCKAMGEEVTDTLKTLVRHPAGIRAVTGLNNKYRALEQQEFNELVIKSADSLAGITEGETLLRKLLAPFKGKIVLIDVWGTWCSPCKEALSHSTEEYARLADYDVAYLYLANRSSEDAWRNVIKMYNVSGDNVAHYNLPDAQQAAIERYLNVHAYPTYRLADREGRLLDLPVNARNLDALERTIRQLHGK